MRQGMQSRGVALAGGGALVAIAAALFFVAPGEWPSHDAPPFVSPPAAPGDAGDAEGAAVPGHAAVAPARRTRTRECAGGAAGAIVVPPRPATDPAGWFSSDDYPWFALMRGLGGIARVDLGVSETGAVIACGIDGSSGHASLDGRTCAIFRTRARFEPARDERGCPVASIWHKNVRWEIPVDSPGPGPR